MNKFIKYFLLFVVAFSLNAAKAQNVDKQSLPDDSANIAENIDSEGISYEEAKTRVESINQALQEDLSKEDIDSYVAELSKLETLLAKKRDTIEKDAKYLQKQLEALSAEPSELEDESITKQREEISQNLAAQNKIIKEAELLMIQIEELTVKILNLRNQKIYGDLITRQSAFINPVVFFSGVKAYVIFFWDVVKSPVDWYDNLPQSQRSYAILSIISMFFIFIISYYN